MVKIIRVKQLYQLIGFRLPGLDWFFKIKRLLFLHTNRHSLVSLKASSIQLNYFKVKERFRILQRKYLKGEGITQLQRHHDSNAPTLNETSFALQGPKV